MQNVNAYAKAVTFKICVLPLLESHSEYRHNIWLGETHLTVYMYWRFCMLVWCSRNEFAILNYYKWTEIDQFTHLQPILSHKDLSKKDKSILYLRY